MNFGPSLEGFTSCQGRIRTSSVCELLRSCGPASRSAESLPNSASARGLHNWVRQDRVDHGEIEGISTKEHADLTRANKRIRELEMEVEILKRASKFLGEDMPHPKGFTR